MNLRQLFYVLAATLGLVIASPGLAEAATYYVSTSGSDTNPGTISSPYATLQKGHDVAVAGDTIYMRGGTYTFATVVTLTRDGTSGNLIKIFNYPGEVPVLDGINITVALDPVIYMNSASWWHIKGLEIKNAANIGLWIENTSSNNIIEMLNVHHNGRLGNNGTGIGAWSSTANNLFLNNDSHHNWSVSTPGNSDGLAVSSTGTGNVARGNRLWRNSDDGLDLWDATAVTVEKNWAWENGYDDALQPITGGDGNGFKLGGTGAGDGGHTVKNNLAWKNKRTGFGTNYGSLPINTYNNTAWSNAHYNFLSFSDDAVAHVFRNNISFAGAPLEISFPAAVDHTFNSWNLAVTVNSADFVSLDFTGATGARQPDGLLPVLDFLKLVSGSDLIDQGTDVGIPYNGSAPDLGAFESGGTTSCHLNVPPTADPPRGGFSYPWNVYTDALTLKAECSTNTVQFDIGDGLGTTIVWKVGGYSKNGSSWEPTIVFSGTPVAGTDWLLGSGTFTTPTLTTQEITSTNYLAAYVCSSQAGVWKCGCTASGTCTGSGLWGFQAWRKAT